MIFPVHGVGAPDYIKETAVSVKDIRPGGKGASTRMTASLAGRLKGTAAELAKRAKKGGK